MNDDSVIMKEKKMRKQINLKELFIELVSNTEIPFI